jgi:hypothetical protein
LANVQWALAQDDAGQSQAALDGGEAGGLVYLPSVSRYSEAPPICRLGVNVARRPAASFDLALLRIGWYIDYKALPSASHPNGAGYAPVINLEQMGESGYISFPRGPALDTAIAANPGADWIIGNEPDRRYFQNDLVPIAYARAFHDLAEYIRSKDPTARLFAGAIVQPTPLRLQYLDEVLRHYWVLFGQALPADGWAIHNFILNERSCSFYNDPLLCWGADIPPGIDATDGLIINIDELQKTADVAFFKQQVVRFRQWMADNGYRNLPLYVSEFGILMPEDRGFPPSLVNNFMNQTFDFMLNQTDETLGLPADNNRLVQRLAWYSTIDPSFNGSLYQSTTPDPLGPPFVLSAIGTNFRDYAKDIDVESDLKLLRLTQQPSVNVSAGQGVTLTLQATVANAGNNQWPASGLVRFYLGDPAAGGVEVGNASVKLPGCGQTAVAEYVWPNPPLTANGQNIYALLQAQGLEESLSVPAVIPTDTLSMPSIRRSWQSIKQ